MIDHDARLHHPLCAPIDTPREVHQVPPRSADTQGMTTAAPRPSAQCLPRPRQVARLWWQSLPALALAAAAASLALAPALVRAESALSVSGGGAASAGSQPHASASASVHFRIVVPPVMRVLENSHPSQLETQANGEASGLQRLVVVSNMKNGFCVALRRHTAPAGLWQLDLAGDPSEAQLTPTADGYRLCTRRPGRYSLMLQHRFQPTPSETPNPTPTVTAMAWPVQTELTSL